MPAHPVAKTAAAQVSRPVSGELIEITPMSQIRKSIAKNMLRSKQSTAHMTLFEEPEVSALVAARTKYKEEYKKEEINLTYLPFVIKAVVAALKRHRELNAEMDFEKGNIIYKNYYNIGIAVSTPEGLVVPVIRDADRLSIKDLSKAVAEIAVKARDRKLTLDDMKDGTFTITNYGALGGWFGVPVINYPQVGILGIGRINQKPVVVNGEIKVGNVMPLSLSVDHRMVDGAEATEFLNDVAAGIADPLYTDNEVTNNNNGDGLRSYHHWRRTGRICGWHQGRSGRTEDGHYREETCRRHVPELGMHSFKGNARKRQILFKIINGFRLRG